MPRRLTQRWLLFLGLAVVSALLAVAIPAWREFSRSRDEHGQVTRPRLPSGLVTNAQGQLRPASAPQVIPQWAVQLRRWWLNHRQGPRPAGAPLPTPAWFWEWNAWKSGVTLEPVAPPPSRVALVIRAAGGDSWLEVRLGSETGPVRYFGTLRRGRSLIVTAGRVWIRAGITNNLVAFLNGRQVRNLPAGVATLLATPSGIETLALG